MNYLWKWHTSEPEIHKLYMNSYNPKIRDLKMYEKLWKNGFLRWRNNTKSRIIKTAVKQTL